MSSDGQRIVDILVANGWNGMVRLRSMMARSVACRFGDCEDCCRPDCMCLCHYEDDEEEW